MNYLKYKYNVSALSTAVNLRKYQDNVICSTSKFVCTEKIFKLCLFNDIMYVKCKTKYNILECT